VAEKDLTTNPAEESGAGDTKSTKQNSNIQELPHVGVRPVSVEREHPDRLIIEGVRFSGDFFRTISYPDPNYLYAIRRDEDGVVSFLVITNVEGAQDFFAEVERE